MTYYINTLLIHIHILWEKDQIIEIIALDLTSDDLKLVLDRTN